MPEPFSINEDSLSTWFTNLRDGESVATKRLWDAYFHRMVLLARRKLSGAKRSVRDEEDIALSAFHSFCRGFQTGKFDDRADQDEENLWPLLVTLTLNKAIDQIRRDNRLKRGGLPDGEAPPWSANAEVFLSQLAGANPPPELEVIADESLERLVALLDETGDEDLRAIVTATFEGESLPDIADRLNCSLRTVQRKLKTARAIWESELA